VVKRVLVIVLAIAALMLRAGAGETVENVLHLAAHGHAAHDTAHAGREQAGSTRGDAHSDPEHGCAGHFHVCHCCAHPVMASASLGFVVPPAPNSAEHLGLTLNRAGPEGTNAPVFRPPIAG